MLTLITFLSETGALRVVMVNGAPLPNYTHYFSHVRRVAWRRACHFP